jgi:hemolysin activation/secretion protein
MALGEIYQMRRNFELGALLRLQATTTPLLPSEQFGLGGYDTVRGYQERQFLADDALCFNLELRSPPLSITSKTRNQLRFLIFTDYAYGHNLHESFAEGSSAQLWSVGPGVRFTMMPYLTSRLDYGFRLHDVEFGNGFGRFHFSVILNY